MQPSLSLQAALFRHQQRQIDALVAGASPAFKAYEARYRRFTQRVRRVTTLEAVSQQVQDSDLVFVGDYHTLRFAQRSFLALLEQAVSAGRRVVLAMEFVEGRHQATLDAFMRGTLGAKRFLETIGHPYSGAFDIWPHFEPIFSFARSQQLEVIGIDKRASGSKSLLTRDRYAAKLIARHAKAADRPLVMVLVGQYHVAPPHLPAEVARALGSERRKRLVILQNPEGAWWKLARAGTIDSVQAIELGEGVVGLFNASPVVSQRTFLDYCEAEAGDAPIEDGGLATTVKTLVKEIGRLARVKTSTDGLEVLTPLDLDALERLERRGNLSRKELAHLGRHVVSGQSAFIPSANAVWLSGFSLNHAAEEAAHVVRHCAIGAAMHRERPRFDAFWARCVEEAIGFFGSKLVNPRRTCPSLEDWKRHFLHGKKDRRSTAAFVLVLSSLADARSRDARRLIPSTLDQFHTVSHALGYLLGDELFEAHRAGTLKAAALEALFRDPVESGPEAYERWKRLARGDGDRLIRSRASRVHARR